MDSLHSSKIKPILRECLAIQSALRDLGYPADDLSLVSDPEGKLYVSLKTPKKDLAVLLGEVDAWEVDDLFKEWERVADAWNDNRISDQAFILRMSKVEKHKEEFITLVKDSGITFPGPELMN